MKQCSPENKTRVTHADGSCVGSVFIGIYVIVDLMVRLSACLFVFHTISERPMQLGSQNVTYGHGPPWVLKTHLFWNQKVEGQGHETQKTVPARVFALLRVLASSGLYCIHRCHLWGIGNASPSILHWVFLILNLCRFAFSILVDYQYTQVDSDVISSFSSMPAVQAAMM